MQDPRPLFFDFRGTYQKQSNLLLFRNTEEEGRPVDAGQGSGVEKPAA